MITPPATAEANTQTETVLPPTIARTPTATSHRDVAVIHHLIDDLTDTQISEQTIHASSVRLYRHRENGQLHRVDVRERIITRPRQETH